MFNIAKKIIFITKDKIIAVEVLDVTTKKFGNSFEFGWTQTTLGLAFNEIVKKFNTSDFRILVSDDLSYIVHVGVPPDTSQDKFRGFVLEKLHDKVPDQVDEGEWDYKVLSHRSETELDVIAFVLVKSFAKALFEAISTSGMVVECIESETIAKTRDANPYIGIALKTDVKGSDKDSLNIQPKPQIKVQEVTNDPVDIKIPTSTVPTALPTRKLSFKFIIVMFILIILGVFVGGLIYFKSHVSVKPQVPTRAEVEVESTASPTPEAREVDLTALKVLIQNGSGIPGEADHVRSLLKNEGFVNFEIKNANSFDFKDTTVALKIGDESVYAKIENALNSTYTVVKANNPQESENDVDVVIIVGSRK